MSFDLVISTYNRPFEVLRLVNEILKCDPFPKKIIVVDSSEDSNVFIPPVPNVLHIRSSHKNQPYQRLLGAAASESDVVVFFDDDLIILNENIFKILLDAFKCPDVVGSTVAIDYHSAIQGNFDPPVLSQKNAFSRFLLTLTGVPCPKLGRASRLGVFGGRPKDRQSIDFFYGPCMSFRKSIIEEIIPIDLLSMYEIKLGKGEDKIISMMASQRGLLIYNPTICLLHLPNESTYYQNHYNFSRKVTYSRLYLSKIFALIAKRPFWLEFIFFSYFSIWRILIGAVSLLIRPSRSRIKKLYGLVSGFYLALVLPQRSKKLTPEINWYSELVNDLQNA